MPLEHPIFNSTAYITLLLMFIVTLSLFIHVHHTGRFNILATILLPPDSRGFNNPVSNFQLMPLLLTAFSLLGYSSMTLSLTPIADTWGNLGLIMLSVILFIAVKYLLVMATFKTLYPDTEPGFISRYHQFTVLGGLLCLIGRAVLSFTVDYTTENAWTAAYIIGAIYCISAAYTFFTTFVKDIRSILRLFLYLCTLEIIPVLVYLKALSLV
ncbi:MAG: DUF4271 domain-containing protein [Paludibacteraceae bacterium]|nr:DUF4271 domain-containing protein [Paludibacteraceae bacterium]